MNRKTKHSSSATKITAHKHADKRANIPTEELRDFVADEEKTPKTILYPRDPSLDPQLVWKGKDEQDQTDLAVPAVPIYIQEKISPQAIIENVRLKPSPPGRGQGEGSPPGRGQGEGSPPGRGQGEGSSQPSLFADFNNIPFEELVDFYHHEQNWANRMILGDSLLVMNSLAEKENLKGQVQMIYIDPPYGIKFGSNWQVSTRKREVKDGKEEDLTRQPEQIKAFRDTWELGIHSYLAYLRDRLTVARELLTGSGSIFVQIGDENVHLVRNVMDEVFGSENFVVQIIFLTTSGFVTNELTRAGDYILWYGKSKDAQIKYRKLFYRINRSYDSTTYRWLLNEDGFYRSIRANELTGKVKLPNGVKFYSPDSITSSNPSPVDQTFFYRGKKYSPGANSHWKANFPKGMENLAKAGRLHISTNSLRYIRMSDDFPWATFNNVWTDTLTGQFTDDKIYVVQTNTKVIERCMLMTTDPGDLVLDPTCGSGTTAYVAEQWGRRWITIDTSRVAIALARTRLMAARYPFYILADSPEGALKEAELSGSLSPALSQRERVEWQGDIKRGFVYKRVPHITLKSIANNEEIDEIHEKWQKKLEPIREQLNRLLKQSWEEWQVPSKLALTPALSRRERESERHHVDPSQGERESDRPHEDLSRVERGADRPHVNLSQGEREQAEQLLSQWWALRRQRQQEIDASIARRAETELLYDQPYENRKIVRVSGPFTVESLSPHRVLTTEEERPESEILAQNQAASSSFEAMIIENLRAAGVENTKKGEKLKFTRLEPYAGVWLHAVGEYEETAPESGETKIKRAAICIGPEHGTVGPELVKDAAIEAVQGIGFDLLVVLGFAFDPHISEEVKRYGRLVVLPARINPDLQMGDLLLKKSGAGNLFTVFGEPDMEVKILPNGHIVVTLKGVDIYDPTTGVIRSSTTDDIACWFIDTEYNGVSFFVRHAYFTGADQPYDKLKRALRAEINEDAWSALYQTSSMPFPRSKTGKIAVKVINHYGDEVLKVFKV